MSIQPDERLQQLTTLLNQYRYSYVSEKELQDGIANALEKEGISFKRELCVSKSDRPDFVVGDIAIEVKIKGSISDLLRQIARYAKHSEIQSILVIGTPHWITRVPASLDGKEISSLRLVGSLL
jgi:aromatic ring-opening dioxygenase catalytic subunit (LigB family)